MLHTKSFLPKPFRWAVFPILIVAFAAPGIGYSFAEHKSRAEKLDPTSLPKEVRDALDRAARVYPHPLKGARWSKVSMLLETDHPLYQLRGTNERGNKIELEVTGAGRIIEVEEHGIPMNEVPNAVIEALRAKMPLFKATQIEAIYQVEKVQPVCYGFEGEDGAGKKVEVYISADGKTFLN